MLLTAVHAQPVCVVTVATAVPPSAPIVCVSGDTAKVHVKPSCVTARDCPATVNVPVRAALVPLAGVFAATV